MGSTVEGSDNYDRGVSARLGTIELMLKQVQPSAASTRRTRRRTFAPRSILR